MKINYIKWMSHNEAIGEFSDGIYTYIIFCHPCNKNMFENIPEILYAFDVNNIMKNTDNQSFISCNKTTLECFCIGKVLSLSPLTVSIGKLKIEIEENIPNDIVIGDTIQFQCNRLDMY